MVIIFSFFKKLCCFPTRLKGGNLITKREQHQKGKPIDHYMEVERVMSVKEPERVVPKSDWRCDSLRLEWTFMSPALIREERKKKKKRGRRQEREREKRIKG